MGRPFQLVRRTEKMQFRLTKLERKIVELEAKELHLSVSDLCRFAVMHVQVYKPLSDEEIEIYRTLIRYKTAFDRTANYFKNSDPRFAGELLSIARELKEHLQKFKK
jgi:hypothetical protein